MNEEISIVPVLDVVIGNYHSDTKLSFKNIELSTVLRDEKKFIKRASFVLEAQTLDGEEHIAFDLDKPLKKELFFSLLELDNFIKCSSSGCIKVKCLHSDEWKWSYSIYHKRQKIKFYFACTRKSVELSISINGCKPKLLISEKDSCPSYVDEFLKDWRAGLVELMESLNRYSWCE